VGRVITPSRTASWTASWPGDGFAGAVGTSGRCALHPVDERHHIAVAGMERDHEVIVADLGGPAQLGAGTVPWVLVVQHHRPAHQRFQFGTFS
jgi:hypothetical protein